MFKNLSSFGIIVEHKATMYMYIEIALMYVKWSALLLGQVLFDLFICFFINFYCLKY